MKIFCWSQKVCYIQVWLKISTRVLAKIYNSWDLQKMKIYQQKVFEFLLNRSCLLTRPANIAAAEIGVAELCCLFCFFFFSLFPDFFSSPLMICSAIFPLLNVSVGWANEAARMSSVVSKMLPKQTDWLRIGVPRLKLFRTRGSTDTDPSPRAKSFGLTGVQKERSGVKRFSRRIAEDWQLGRLSWSLLFWAAWNSCCCCFCREAKNSAMPKPLGLLWVRERKNFPDLRLEARTRLSVDGGWGWPSTSTKVLESPLLTMDAVAKRLFLRKLLSRRRADLSSSSSSSVELSSLLLLL